MVDWVKLENEQVKIQVNECKVKSANDIKDMQ